MSIIIIVQLGINRCFKLNEEVARCIVVREECGRCCSSFQFLCVVLLCVFTFRVPCCDVCYDYRITAMFCSSFTSSCLQEESCLFYVICVCLRIVMSNTYSVVFLFCLFSSCVPYVASFSGLSILIAPSVFSNVYLLPQVVFLLGLPSSYVLCFVYPMLPVSLGCLF